MPRLYKCARVVHCSTDMSHTVAERFPLLFAALKNAKDGDSMAGIFEMDSSKKTGACVKALYDAMAPGEDKTALFNLLRDSWSETLCSKVTMDKLVEFVSKLHPAVDGEFSRKVSDRLLQKMKLECLLESDTAVEVAEQAVVDAYAAAFPGNDVRQLKQLIEKEKENEAARNVKQIMEENRRMAEELAKLKASVPAAVPAGGLTEERIAELLALEKRHQAAAAKARASRAEKKMRDDNGAKKSDKGNGSSDDEPVGKKARLPAPRPAVPKLVAAASSAVPKPTASSAVPKPAKAAAAYEVEEGTQLISWP